MKALFITIACTIATVATLSLSGCDRGTAAEQSRSPSESGRPCKVQFRRDALGAAASLPISPMVSGINGATTAVSCTYKSTRDEWIIVNYAERELWIPKAVILLIEFER